MRFFIMQTDEVSNKSKCLKGLTPKVPHYSSKRKATHPVKITRSRVRDESCASIEIPEESPGSAVSHHSRPEQAHDAYGTESLTPAGVDHLDSPTPSHVGPRQDTNILQPTLSGDWRSYSLPFNPISAAYPCWIQPVVFPIGSDFRTGECADCSGNRFAYSFGPVIAHPMPVVLIPLRQPELEASSSVDTTSRVFTSGSSVNSDASVFTSFPAVLIERNAFKQWFEGYTPDLMKKLPFKLKRYKSIQTFTHWLESHKRLGSLELNILIKVTEVPRLLGEVKSAKNLRIFAYEHLLDPRQQPGKSARVLISEADSLRKDFDPHRLAVCTCLEQASTKLLSFYREHL